MADQLYLSYWLRGFTEANMLRHLEKAVRLFPFSRLAPGIALRVYAVSLTEPIQFEQSWSDPVDWDSVMAAAREFRAPDVGFQIEGRWDIWQFDQDWSLKPQRISLYCFAPRFERDQGEHLTFDLGLDVHFLPQPEIPGSARIVQSNVRSLLHLVHELDRELAVERRQLWAESGENFAEKLERTLQQME